MLYSITKSIRAELLKRVKELRDVQKFNNQYEGIIHAEPIAFIEYPDPIEVLPISKQTRRADIDVRIHIASKILSDVDGVIPDKQQLAHELMALKAKNYLDGFLPSADCTQLIFRSWQDVAEYKGWLVTWIDLAFRMNEF